MANQYGYKGRDAVRQIVGRAVEKSHLPTSPSLGATPGRNHSTGVFVTPDIDGNDYIDEEGVPIRTALTEVDFTDDPTRLTI